jgi:hypothetical protein
LTPGQFVKLSPANADYLDKSKLVGVFVKGLLSEETHHAGFIFAYEPREEDTGQLLLRETRQLDFIDDHRVLFQTFKPGAQWLHAVIDFDPHSRTAFAGYLGAVAETHEEMKSPILFGTMWPELGKYFDSEGNYEIPADRDGLSCATFMAEIIVHEHDSCVAFDTWPEDDPDDLKWLGKKVEKLRAKVGLPGSEVTAERVDKLAAATKWKRLRPVQAAAVIASGNGNWPMAHEKAHALAEKVIADFAQAFGPAPPPPPPP